LERTMPLCLVAGSHEPPRFCQGATEIGLGSPWPTDHVPSSWLRLLVVVGHQSNETVVLVAEELACSPLPSIIEHARSRIECSKRVCSHDRYSFASIHSKHVLEKLLQCFPISVSVNFMLCFYGFVSPAAIKLALIVWVRLDRCGAICAAGVKFIGRLGDKRQSSGLPRFL